MSIRRKIKLEGARVSFSGQDDSGAGNLHLHGLRMAVTAADNLDFEGRVLAKACIAASNYHRDEIAIAANSTAIIAAGLFKNG